MKFDIQNTCIEAQRFAGNSVSYYKDHGLTGHTGIDVVCGYGHEILSPYDGYVYKVMTQEHPAWDGSGYTAVCMIVDDGVELFEYQAGHCNPTVTEGTYVKKGDVIGTEANHGLVWSVGVQITYAMQKAGDTRGSHTHHQKRPVIKVKKNNGYLLTVYNTGDPFKDKEGYSYEYGYDALLGCVDPLKPVLYRDIWFGMSGYDVACLQRIFKKEGLADYDATGYFGIKTLVSAIKFQEKYNIKPTYGYVGPITRSLLVHKYF